MAQFKARIQGPRGILERTIEAPDVDLVRALASREGTVLSIQRDRSIVLGGLNYSERQIFLTRLSAMLESGVGAAESLRIIHKSFTGRIKKISHEMLYKVEGGTDVPTAISEIGSPDFPPTFVALLKAGAQGGSTHEAINEALEFDRDMKVVKSESSKGLMQAVFTFLMAGAMIAGSVFWMMPMVMNSGIAQMAKDGISIEWVVTLANAAGYFMGFLTLVMLILVLISFVGKRVSPQLADAIILKIPVYKDLVLAQKNYISFYGMSLLVKVGVQMEMALALTAESAEKGALRDDFIRARDAVRAGREWAVVMNTLHPTDRAALAAAMDREQVNRSLMAIARQYKQLYVQRLGVAVPTLTALGGFFMSLSGVIMFGVTVLPMMQAMQEML